MKAKYSLLNVDPVFVTERGISLTKRQFWVALVYLLLEVITFKIAGLESLILQTIVLAIIWLLVFGEYNGLKFYKYANYTIQKFWKKNVAKAKLD